LTGNHIATAIAIVAVMIATMQWWNSRQQLVLNLFEKRFQVFLDVRRVASEAQQGAQIASKGLTNEIFARGRFLFGRELVKQLERLHALVSDLESGRATAAIDIRDHFDKITPLFDPYLKMPQRGRFFLFDLLLTFARSPKISGV
jgi:hypothetical protein